MDDKNSLINKYKGKPYPSAEKVSPSPALVKTETAYQAIIEAKRNVTSRWFRIIDRDGTTYRYNYANIMDWQLNASATLLTLKLTSAICILEGVHLQEIDRLLAEEKIAELREFNPEQYNLPDQEGETVIERLVIDV